MAGKPCGYLVVSDGNGGLAKLHFEGAEIERLVGELDFSESEINRLLAGLSDTPGPAPKAAVRPSLVPAERLAVLGQTLAATLEAAEVAAARSSNFLSALSAAIGRGLTATRDPAILKALRGAAQRAEKGLWATIPPRADIEAIVSLLPYKERYPLIARWGSAMHQATFAELRAAVAANKDLAGWVVQSDRQLSTLVRELGAGADAARAQAVVGMTVEDYLSKVVGLAPPGTREARLDRLLVKAFGKSVESGKPVQLGALRPDVVLVDSSSQVRGVFDLTSIGEQQMRLVAELAAEELKAFDEFAALRRLSPEEAGRAVLASKSEKAAEQTLKISKELHARRGALVQHVLGHLDLLGATNTGEFYYRALRVWGPAQLP